MYQAPFAVNASLAEWTIFLSPNTRGIIICKYFSVLLNISKQQNVNSYIKYVVAEAVTPSAVC